jgi:hypothetical protein
MREVEAHLWALVVWFGGAYDDPYVNRDVAAAARYVECHLSGEDMTTRHRAVIARGASDDELQAASKPFQSLGTTSSASDEDRRP